MFKDKLKENRIKLEMSQDDLAQKIFVSRSAVAKWEQGRGIPEDESLDRLADLFGTTTDLLLTKQDMKEDMIQGEKNVNKSKKKAIISYLVAGLAVGALAITLLSGTFAYGPTGNEQSETLNINGVTRNEERIVNVDFEGKGKIDYSKWQKAVFKDEGGTSVSSVQDLSLRSGDQVKISYLADANMFGRKRIGSTGISEISLLSHSFTSAETLFGVGYSFSVLDFEKPTVFDPDEDNVAYVRWFQLDPTSVNPTIDLATKNIYSLKISIGVLHDRIKIGIAFDPAQIKNDICEPFFNDFSNKWTRYFSDMMTGGLSCGESIAAGILGSFSATYEGAIPGLSRPCGYHYVDYDVTVFAKNNPEFYMIKSYDISDAIIGTEKVLPSTDLSSLSFPTGRSYSVVEEYLNNSLVSTSEKIPSGGKANVYFSNSCGFYDRLTSQITL